MSPPHSKIINYISSFENPYRLYLSAECSKFSPEHISISDGTLPSASAEFEDVALLDSESRCRRAK
ncbi:hypothetical protein SAMN05428977_10791 [Nitrosomonas sp. Nm166]|nr:hypothetical protein SAMN05428977_10791 [Nitrosomonas sp. Nm166]